jgi:GABA permease
VSELRRPEFPAYVGQPVASDLDAVTGAPAPQLSRSLSRRHITLISLGGIIGAGLFVGSSASIAAAGPAIVLSYLVAGGLLLLIMRMLGEMAIATPQVRAFTDFAREGLGHGAGFIVGWLYWYFWVITVAIEAIAGANLLQAWLPLPRWWIGVGLMAIMTGVNLLSTRSYGEVEFWFASIKVAAIIVFIAIAAAYAFGLTSPHGATFGNLVNYGGFMPHGIIAVFAGVITVFGPLTGAEITTIAAVESKEPARAVARMATSVVGRILLFYVGSVFLIVSVVPWTKVVPGKSPFTLALDEIGVSWAAAAMNVIILTAVLSCLNSAFYVTSRVLFVLAAHRDAPRALVHLNRRLVPARSVMIGSAAGFLGIMAAVLWPDTIFAFLVNAAGTLILFVYASMCLAQIRLRRSREAAGAPDPPLKMWLFPWASYAALAGILVVLVAMAFTQGLASQFWASFASLGIAVIAYLLRRRFGHANPAASGASTLEDST